MKFELLLWILFIFLFYSFIGWLGEVLFILLKEKKFVNRGITNGPFCTLYGLIAVVLSLTLDDIDNTFLVFLSSILYSTIIQYIVGKILSSCNKQVWWDYSNKKYNVDGYICLNYSLLWGLFGTILIRFINPLLLTIFKDFNVYIAGIILYTLMGLFLVDLLTSFITLKKIRKNKIKKHTASFMDWIYASIKNRLDKAYPTFSKKNLKHVSLPEGISLTHIFYLFIICAFLGALVEIIYCRFSMHRWMSRSSIIFGQFSFVWGFAIVLITLLFYRFKNKSNFTLFILGTILGGAYEYFCSVYTEVVYGTIFWDYSKIPFNLNGRINLLFCFFWGFATIVVVRYVISFLIKEINKIPKKIFKPLAVFLFVFLLLDLGVSEVAMRRYKSRLNGIEAQNYVERLCDKYADNDFMKKRYSNMKMVNK